MYHVLVYFYVLVYYVTTLYYRLVYLNTVPILGLGYHVLRYGLNLHFFLPLLYEDCGTVKLALNLKRRKARKAGPEHTRLRGRLLLV